MSSCTFNEGVISRQISEIDNDIREEKYDAAQNKLQKYSSMHDRFVYQYNRAVVSILAGECDSAEQMLESILAEIESKEDKDEQDAQTLEDSSRNQLYGNIHLAIAMADLCLNSKHSDEQSNQQYENILAHFYAASAFGLKLNDPILEVIRRWIPPCDHYIEGWQIASSDPEQALDMAAVQNKAVTVCPNGVWATIKARKHENLASSIQISPLDRQVWLDDSSKLPFSQLNIDIFDHIPAEGEEPRAHFSQPIPETLPPASAYQSLNYGLNDFRFEKDGVHYIHLYTKNNGELKLRFSYRKETSCDYLDDLTTYNASLQPIVNTLSPDTPYPELLLCPGRPDMFTFSLDSGQYALIALNEAPNDEKNELPMQSPLFNLLDAGSLQLSAATTRRRPSAVGKTETFYFKTKPETRGESAGEPQSEFILIHNSSANREKYLLNLSLPEAAQSIQYSLLLSLSHPCPGEKSEQTFPLHLENIDQTRLVQALPVWVCPDNTVTYRPFLPTNTPLLRARAEHRWISGEAVGAKDIQLESYLADQNAERFLVEQAQPGDSLWDNAEQIRNHNLLKPMTPDTVFVLQTEHKAAGFSLMTVRLNEDDNSSDDSKESRDNQEKEDKKDQRDETKKQDTPNKSPDKPSETPATAKGAGDDAQGHDSTPDEKATGKNASQLDMEKYERDQIDDLLDAIEKGHYYVPLSGSEEAQTSDKDW